MKRLILIIALLPLTPTALAQFGGVELTSNVVSTNGEEVTVEISANFLVDVTAATITLASAATLDSPTPNDMVPQGETLWDGAAAAGDVITETVSVRLNEGGTERLISICSYEVPLSERREVSLLYLMSVGGHIVSGNSPYEVSKHEVEHLLESQGLDRVPLDRLRELDPMLHWRITNNYSVPTIHEAVVKAPDGTGLTFQWGPEFLRETLPDDTSKARYNQPSIVVQRYMLRKGGVDPDAERVTVHWPAGVTAHDLPEHLQFTVDPGASPQQKAAATKAWAAEVNRWLEQNYDRR